MFLLVGLLAVCAAEPVLDVRFHGCSAAQVTEITRLLGVELTGREPPHELVVSIVCTPSTIRLEAADDARRRQRELDAATSERAVALAAVELIDALDDAPATPLEQPAATAPTGAPKDATPPTERGRFMLSVGALAGVTHAPSAFDVGGLIAGDVHPFAGLPQLGAHLDVLFDTSQRHLTPGQVTIERIGIGAALDWSTTGLLWRANLGAGARGGPLLARSGRTTQALAHDGTSTWFGPMVRAGLQRSLSDHLVLLAGVEAGLVTRAVNLLVDGTRQSSLDGAWIFGTLGIGMML